MKIWIITQTCCDEYVSTWRSQETAQAEVNRLNAEYREKYGRDHYEWQEDELNG
jgi:hypothetical protein